MAISTSTTFFSAESLTFLKSSPTSSPSSLRLLAAPTPRHNNLRYGRLMVTCAAASSKTSQPRGIMIPRRVSPEMAELVGVPEISRTQALKSIWAYIKEHNLQDPANKKIIKCDDKLKKIFAGKDQIGFLEIAGLITPHFLK
ncbi:Upstream activation factor subunit spp27 [Linum grandiflorum]